MEKQDVGFKQKVMQQNKEDLDKANVVKEQRKVQEAVMYQRVLLQKNLSKANQMPQHEQFKTFEEHKRVEVTELQEAMRENLTTLNDICVLLGKRINVNLNRATHSDNIFDVIDKNYEKLIPTWEELVQKWHSRTQVNTNVLNKKLSKKNVALSALQQPILTQVYKTLENKQFIETRSHQKREVYRVLGKPAESINDKIDFEIYDDHDFYQSLMKEFLNTTSDTLDAPQADGETGTGMSLTQEYLRKREKMKMFMDKKKKKSNKVSKDRKLKYIIHDKLINFMAPQDLEQLSAGREDILKILFGWSVADGKEKPVEDAEKVKFTLETKSTKRVKTEEDDEDLGMELI